MKYEQNTKMSGGALYIVARHRRAKKRTGKKSGPATTDVRLSCYGLLAKGERAGRATGSRWPEGRNALNSCRCASVHRARAGAARIAARAARAGRRRVERLAAGRADGEHRQQLLQIVTLAGRALGRLALARQILEMSAAA